MVSVMARKNPTTSPDDQPEFLPFAKVALKLGVSVATVYRLADEGALNGVYIRGRRYVQRSELARYIDSLTNVPA